MVNVHVSELLDSLADHLGEDQDALDHLDRFAGQIADIEDIDEGELFIDDSMAFYEEFIEL